MASAKISARKERTVYVPKEDGEEGVVLRKLFGFKGVFRRQRLHAIYRGLREIKRNPTLTQTCRLTRTKCVLLNFFYFIVVTAVRDTHTSCAPRRTTTCHPHRLQSCSILFQGKIFTKSFTRKNFSSSVMSEQD